MEREGAAPAEPTACALPDPLPTHRNHRRSDDTKE